MSGILERDTSKELTDEAIQMALHHIASGHHSEQRLDLAEKLLKRGADPGVQDDDGKTALRQAAGSGNVHMIRLFLRVASARNQSVGNRIADFFLSGIYGAGDKTTDAVIRDIVLGLLGSSAGPVIAREDRDLWQLGDAIYGYEKIMGLLKSENTTKAANERSQDAQKLLLIAVMYGHEALIQLLLQMGVDLEAQDRRKRTPLLLAATYGHEAVLEILLGLQAKTEQKDALGQTPLVVAAARGHFVIVKLLLDNGADIEAKDLDGCTALLAASAQGHDTTVGLLLEEGADIMATDKSERTALSRAEEEEHWAVRIRLAHAMVKAGYEYGKAPRISHNDNKKRRWNWNWNWMLVAEWMRVLVTFGVIAVGCRTIINADLRFDDTSRLRTLGIDNQTRAEFIVIHQPDGVAKNG